MIVVAFCYFFPFQILDANTMFINKKFKPKHARIDEFSFSQRQLMQWSSRCLLCMIVHLITHAVSAERQVD